MALQNHTHTLQKPEAAALIAHRPTKAAHQHAGQAAIIIHSCQGLFTAPGPPKHAHACSNSTSQRSLPPEVATVGCQAEHGCI